jgi:hypothetical protein
MSYEITDCVVHNITARTWKVTRATFTGAAVLKREKAAYKSTWIKLGSWEAGKESGN